MSERTVHCVKLGREAPGLESPPIPGELGQKVFENVSQEGWEMFRQYFIMVVNEYRLDLTDDATNEIFTGLIDEFFFGEGAEMPKDYVPPEA